MAGLASQPGQSPDEGEEFTQLSLWPPQDSSDPDQLSLADSTEVRYAAPVKALPSGEESPRQRLREVGPRGLSIAELLTLIVGSENVALARSVIAACQESREDFIAHLRHTSVEELVALRGIGEARAAAIVAAIELGKRVYQPRPQPGTVVDDPKVAAGALSQELMSESQERFAILFLDVRHRILSSQVLTIGSATETIANPREIFGEATRRRAVKIIVAHNHPSGSLEPSPEDIALTKQLLQSGKVLALPVLDHLILANGSYRSLRETTSLWSEVSQDD